LDVCIFSGIPYVEKCEKTSHCKSRYIKVDSTTIMRISVITVAYKNSKVVVDLLNSIHKYNDIGDELEVIIVDNSPEDCRIEDAIKVADYKGYTYIPADNRGFGAGNNIGAAVAQGKILAFLNPDIILIEPIFKKILEKFNNDDKLAWVGGQLLDKNGKRNFSFGYRFEYSNCSLFESVKFKIEEYFQKFDKNRMYLIGADIIIRCTIFEQIGKFDENIFMYHEENDLTQRVLKIVPNAKIRFCSDIRMVHLEGHSMNFISAQAMKLCFESSLYYCQKYGIDAKDIYRKLYRWWKQRLFVDSFIRPQNVEWRKQYLRMIEEKLPELKE